MPVASLPLDNSRALPRLGGARAKLNATTQSSARSPDGYFSPSEDFRQMFRNPFLNGGPIENTPTTIGRRNSHQIMPDLQDVQEDETTDPAHRWIRPTRFDSRSPCPALNTAANHGYLPRDGRKLTMWAIIKALRECYNVSWVLAALFTVGSFVILRLGGVGEGWINPRIDLEDLAAHNILEHNGSMTHLDLDEEIARKNEQRNGSRSPRSPRSRSSSGSSTSSTTVERPSSLSLFPLTPSRVFDIAHWLFSFSTSIVLSFLPGVAGAKASAEATGHMSPGGSLYGSANANASAGLLFQHLSLHASPTKYHRTPRHGHPCAPIRPHRPLIDALFADSASGTHLTLKDVARARIRRCDESQGRSRKTPAHLEQFADAEFCLTLALFSDRDDELRADIGDLRQWLENERLPSGWRPRREVGFWQNHLNTARLQEIIKGYRKYRSRGREVRTVAFD